MYYQSMQDFTTSGNVTIIIHKSKQKSYSPVECLAQPEGKFPDPRPLPQAQILLLPSKSILSTHGFPLPQVSSKGVGRCVSMARFLPLHFLSG